MLLHLDFLRVTPYLTKKVVEAPTRFACRITQNSEKFRNAIKTIGTIYYEGKESTIKRKTQIEGKRYRQTDRIEKNCKQFHLQLPFPSIGILLGVMGK